MVVLKFGGTSLANADCFLKVCEIIIAKYQTDRVAVVLSAPARVTNLLVDFVTCVNSKKDFSNSVEQIKVIFDDILKGLQTVKNFPYIELKNLIDKELQGVLQFANKEICDPKSAVIHSLGEKLSILVMQGLLQSYDLKISIIDPTQKLLAKGNYFESTVDLKESEKLIAIENIDPQSIILMAGFTAKNSSGETVLLGRNGSDYSASVLACCIKAKSLEIWTDVSGILNADPKFIPTAKALEQLSYDEALELAILGAKVIHPKAIAPLLERQIPCYIKNTNFADDKGTLISSKQTKGVKSIAYLENYAQIVKQIDFDANLALVSLVGCDLVDEQNLIAQFSQTLQQNSIKIIYQTTSKHSLRAVIPANTTQQALNALHNAFFAN